MRASLRTQLVLVIGLLMCVIVGASTYTSIQNTKRNALQLMAWRSEAMTQDTLRTTIPQVSDAPDMPDIVAQQIKDVLIQSAILFGVSLVVSFLTVSGVMHIRFTKPLRKLMFAGQQLAEGRLVQTFQVGQQSTEIAELAGVFENLASYWQHIVTVGAEIANGGFISEGHVHSDHDIVGKTLHEMAQYLQQIAEDVTKMKDGDFTVTIQVRSTSDTFGQVLQTMVTGFNDLLRQIRTSMEQMTNTGTNITAFAERELSIVHDVHTSGEVMMATMTEIGASAEEVMHNMDMLSSSVEETSASVAQMTTSITQITSYTKNLTRQTQETIAFLDMTVSALQDIVNMTETSQQISQETLQHALGGQHAVEQVMASMTILQHTITTGVEAITTFAHRSREIGTILNVIQEITERTSLLALNASIIAAQAGIHGRGFAVVADEIKNLAQGVTASTKDIAAIVRSLQQDVHHVVESIQAGVADVKQGLERTHQAEGALQTIIASAKHSSAKVIEIVAALNELMTTSREVSDSMEQVNLMTEEITTATKEHESCTKQINQAITHINDMTAHIQQATAQQSAGAHQVLTTTQTMLDLTDQNLESSRQIVLTTEELSTQAAPLLQVLNQLKLRA